MAPRHQPAFPIDLDALPGLPLIGQVAQAYWFAAGAHYAVGQKRSTGGPYFEHVEQVARIVSYALGTTGEDDIWEVAVSAALLHDVVEDTKVMSAEVHAIFGAEIATVVAEVTDVSRPEHGNRAERKRLDREHVWRAGRLGQTVKLADLCSNTSDITACNPAFAKVYMPEKRLVMKGLTKGHRLLAAQAWYQIQQWEAAQVEPRGN